MQLKTHFIKYLFLLVITTSCKKEGEDCNYLIPKDYEGNLLIIFDQKDGVDTSYEGSTRIYNFDSTGILKTKFTSNYGMKRHNFYYLDNLNNRIPIGYLQSTKFEKNDKVIVFMNNGGKDFDYKNNVDRHFEILTVAKQKNLDSIVNSRSWFLVEQLQQ